MAPRMDKPKTRECEDFQVTIPRALLELFDAEPRILIKWHPTVGIPVDFAQLQGLLGKMKENPTLAENYDLFLMNKTHH